MTNAKKSYIVRNSMAPYRKPSPSIISGRRKPSFLNKIKSFFQPIEGTTTEESSNNNKTETTNKRSVSAFQVPGGFYNAEAAAESSAILSKRIESMTAESTFADDNLDEEEANVSNAKLASFFKDKGDRPLTDMEMEGVISVMKRCRSVSSTPYGSRIISESKTVPNSKVLRATSESIATPLRAPSYNPRYDDSASVGNNSIRSTRSSVTRRIFDYSKLPSPYRTTVYKYSAASLPKNKESITTTTTANKVTRNRNTPKKLSNTASALMSILDGNSEKNDQKKVSAVSNVANPYSSHISRIRKSKTLIEANSSLASTPPKVFEEHTHTNNNGIAVYSNNVHPTRKEPSLSGVQTNASLIELSESQKSQNAEKKHGFLSKSTDNEANHEDASSTNGNAGQYKPNKSSSLRKAITLEKSPEKPANEVPTSSNFSFSFKKPESSSLPVVPSSSIAKPDDTKRTKADPSKLFSFGKVTVPQPADSELPSSASHILDNKPNNVNFGNAPKATKEAPASSLPSLTTIASEKPTKKERFTFVFADIPRSNVDQQSIDQSKVEQYRSMFAF